jgi:hypothetical protein
MAYMEPQLNIFQEFSEAPTDQTSRLDACIIGVNSRVITEDNADLAGVYDKLNGNDISIDSVEQGTIRPESVNVILKDAFVPYLENLTMTLASSTKPGTLTSESVLVTGEGFDRLTVLGNRDVRVGDPVQISYDGKELETSVLAISGATSSAIGVVTSASGNQAPVASDVATITDDVADGDITLGLSGTYDGVASGVMSEVYTITITKDGVLGTAECSIETASGTVLENDVVISGDIDLGRGLTVNISGVGSFLTGEVIEVSGAQAYTEPAVTEGGTYMGTRNTTYIVQVQTPGIVGSTSPVLRITTVDGYDVSETLNPVVGTNLVGNYGLSIEVANGDIFLADDAWSIEVSAASTGALKTVQFANSLIFEGVQMPEAATATVTFGSYQTITEQYAMPIALPVGLTTVEQETGLENSVPVTGGDIYVTYVKDLTQSAPSMNVVSSLSDVSDILGDVTPENALAYGVYKALENSAGAPIYFIAISEDTLEEHTKAMDILTTQFDIYGLVPLTQKVEILNAYVTFTEDESSASNTNWKKSWLNKVAEKVSVVRSELTATITDDTDGEYRVVTISEGDLLEGQFVQAGDILRYNYRTVLGESLYDTAVVEAVTGSTTLTLTEDALSMPIAANIKIVRDMSNVEFAEAQRDVAQAIGSRRISNVPQETVLTTEGEVKGYFLCAALCGVRAGLAPHAPMTNHEVRGFVTVSNFIKSFNRTQLNIMAGGGNLLVLEKDGVMFVRHQLTTDMTNEDTMEDSVTSNLDNISRTFKSYFAPLIGRSNVSPTLIGLLKNKIGVVVNTIINRPYSELLGPQMIDFELLTLEQDPVLKSKVRFGGKPSLPKPLNSLDIFFYI